MPARYVTDLSQPVQYFGLAVLVLVIQFLLVATTFPPSELQGSVALLHIDNALHGYLVKLGVILLAKSNVVGYDPFFGAGYLNGLHYNRSAHVPTLLAMLFSPGVDEVHMYKAYVFGAAVIAAVAVFVAAIALRLAPFEFPANPGAAVRGIAAIAPNRFARAGYLLLCLPAARGLSLMGQSALKRKSIAWEAFSGGAR